MQQVLIVPQTYPLWLAIDDVRSDRFAPGFDFGPFRVIGWDVAGEVPVPVCETLGRAPDAVRWSTYDREDMAGVQADTTEALVAERQKLSAA